MREFALINAGIAEAATAQSAGGKFLAAAHLAGPNEAGRDASRKIGR
jgi:hypothetical protein